MVLNVHMDHNYLPIYYLPVIMCFCIYLSSLERMLVTGTCPCVSVPIKSHLQLLPDRIFCINVFLNIFSEEKSHLCYQMNLTINLLICVTSPGHLSQTTLILFTLLQSTSSCMLLTTLSPKYSQTY